MRNINFLLKTFLVGVMMMFASFTVYSQILGHAVASKKGGGTGNCYSCTMFVIYDIRLQILPNHFPFKVEETTFTDLTENGFHLTFGSQNSYTTSQVEIINPYTNTTVPNHVIQANSPFLTSNGLSIKVRVEPSFCVDLNADPSLFKGYKMDTEVRLTNIGQGTGNSDVSVILSKIITFKNPCVIVTPNPFLFSESQSTLLKGELFESRETVLDANQVSISPNPFADKVEIKSMFDKEQSLEIKIFNQTGQRILMNNSSNLIPAGEITSIINLEAFPVGIYYIHLISTSGSQIFKMLKTSK